MIHIHLFFISLDLSTDEMNKAKDGEVNATDVGRQFLTKYYNAMANDVEQVVHFYSDSSNVKRFGKPAVSGLEVGV
jgi:hypothetical protein